MNAPAKRLQQFEETMNRENDFRDSTMNAPPTSFKQTRRGPLPEFPVRARGRFGMEKFPVALFACLLSAGRGLVNFLKIKRVEEGEPYGVLKVLKSGLLVWAYPLLPLGIAFGLSDCLAETKALDKGGVFVIWGFAALGSHCIHACCRCAFIGEEE